MTSTRLALAIVVAGLLHAPALAEDAPVHRHALSLIGEPKYPADFAHFDFVNPDAPKGGIVRMADATVPMDEALASVVLDISGRGYSVLELPFAKNDMLGFPTDLVRHFLESFAVEARLNLHARVLYGSNDHHKAEAIFKALARALNDACRIDERIALVIPSTKDVIEG